MKASEIQIGGLYRAKIGAGITTVRVDDIRTREEGNHRTRYDVTNLVTGRRTTFASAQKFRGPAKQPKAQPAFADLPSPIPVPEPPPALASMLAQAKGAASQPAYATPISQKTYGGKTPTEEQVAIIEAAKQQGCRVLVIEAGAGAGKTSTLKMLEEELPGRGQYTAFNAALVAESKSKFTRAQCNTTHSLAFRAEGERFAGRLNSCRMRSDEVAQRLGISSMTLVLGPDASNPAGGCVVKTLKPGTLATLVSQAVRRFCQSDDKELSVEHFGYIDGIDRTSAEGKRTYANNDLVKKELLFFAKRMWADLSDPEGELPFSHDVYVKVWELNHPHIACDYLLLDESQDTAEVMVSILKQQSHVQLILVGDENQAIYGWRGNVNATRAFPDAERLWLSQSFRFGPPIADVANAVLSTLAEPTELHLKGLPSIPSTVVLNPTPLDPHCVLCRTNAGAIGTLLRKIDEGKHPYLVGGTAEVTKFLRAVLNLKTGRGTDHPELACFKNWKEVEEFASTAEGEDLKLMVKLIKDFGADTILEALEDMPEERDADLVISTAHKSKGREWPVVQLAGDFPTADKMDDEGRRLLYVAVTRAQRVLDISNCPPFIAGQKDRDGGTIPYISIQFGSPLPTVAQALEGGTDSAVGAIAKAPTSEPAEAPPSAPAPKPAEATGCSWTKGRNGDWLVRGPASLAEAVDNGDEPVFVEVVKRSGQKSRERLTKVIWKDGEIGLYKVG